MTVYVFPGQGSQVEGMGEGLFDQFPEITDTADEVLGYSIKTLCLENPENKLFQTEFTQPALYTVNALYYLQKIQDGDDQPDVVAGHSLGEYNALFAAGVMDFVTGLKLVAKRGELMSQANEGAMAAVMGLSASSLNEFFQQNALRECCVANINSPIQTIISGPRNEILQAKEHIDEIGTCTVLNVSGAFHSPLMQPIQHAYASYLKNFKFNSPEKPVIANITAKPYPKTTGKIRDFLAKQITCPVLWLDTVQALLADGQTDFCEIGPGTILTTLINRIKLTH